MIRLALGYLAFAVAAILLVTGLPFGLSRPGPAPQIAAVSDDVPGSTGSEGRAPDGAPKVAIDASIAETTALVVQLLAAAPADARNTGTDALSSTALAALQAARTPGEVTLESLLAQAIAAGQNAADIDHLLNEAVAQGSVRVPVMMLTTEGRVDTSVLIASILANSLTTTNEQGDSSIDDSYVTPETAILDIQDIDYTVLAGDSLGALSLKFYGTPAHAEDILAVNRQILATPSSLRAGQILVIPSRSKL